MADLSKAERLAAARRKLQDYQRSKGRPLPSSVTSAENFREPLLGQDTVILPESDHQRANPQEEHTPKQIQSVHSCSPPSQTITTNHDLNHESSANGHHPHTVSSDLNVSKSQELIDSHYKAMEEPILNNSPMVFSASSFFDSVSDTAPDLSIILNVNGEQLNSDSHSGQGTPLQTTSHLFDAMNYGNQNWNIQTKLIEDSSHTNGVPLSDDSFNHVGLSLSEEVSRTPEVSPSAHLLSSEMKSLVNTKEKYSESACIIKDSDDCLQSCTSADLGIMEPEISQNEFFSNEHSRQQPSQTTQLLSPPISESYSQDSPVILSLEAKNQELAAQLSLEHRSNQQLHFTLKENQSLISHLEAKILDLQSQQEMVLARHIGPLQEQLRAHAQTVGILVGEKTELEAALAHHVTAAKQHTSEVEELQSRLRASRHRVSELEKELSTLSVAVSTADKQRSDHAHELDQLRLQNSLLSKQLEDAEEEASELRQKLSTRVSEVETLELQLQEKQSQLSLAQLRVTQLSSCDNPEASAEIESLHQHKMSLEVRCAELIETVRQLTAERDQADQQYQQYVAQLNAQLQTVCSRLDSVTNENEKLRNREEQLVRNMSELERQLQQQVQLHHHQTQHLMDSKISSTVCSEDHSGVFERVSQLEEVRQNLSNSLDLQAQEMSRLKDELEDREARIAELETLCNEKPDQARLLAAMESDKVAAAQATSQNTMLKQQLQELQDGFIKLSNDKLRLTEDLEHEKHVNKEMGEKISLLAEELHDLRMSVLDKERRLQEYQALDDGQAQNHLHENCNDLNHNHTRNVKSKVDGVYNHDQECYDQPTADETLVGSSSISKPEDTSSLQEQLNQAKDHIHNLSSQNNNLRRLLAQKSTESHESGSSSSATEGAPTDDATADLDTNCEDIQNQNSTYITMQYAMEKLQERFTRTMAEVADLTEEKQRLEHLVLQLQGETETIGEYVTLYQIQRSVLQQRAKEKDHQLACLAAEREDLRRKLNDLNALVHRLVEENAPETATEALPVQFSSAVNDETTVPENGTVELHHLNPEDDVKQQEDSNASTAGKILALLSEIGSSSLVDTSNTNAEAFHPCPWCSGRLITV